MAAHGIKCEGCEGIGIIPIEFTEWHPYGDTVVPEELIAFDDCPECNGLGYHLDDRCCIVCGLPVEDGVQVEGWEVHEHCETEGVPTLEVDLDARS